jgi:hypothetical protein
LLPSPRNKKNTKGSSKGKVMLELSFDSSGIVYVKFIPEGATVTRRSFSIYAI